MSKHAWKDEAIAMKIAGVPLYEIAENFSRPYSSVVHATRGIKANRHEVCFLPDLFDDINAYARDKDMSFSSAVASLAAKALSDIRSAS